MRAYLLIPVLLVAPTLYAQSNCESLASVSLHDGTITSAKESDGICKISGVLKPSSDSDIHFEVWLPISKWNGKYLGVGNGGFAGSIDYPSLERNAKNGYATAATDTGHDAESTDATWAYKHPEKLMDFGSRAIHETTETAKIFIAKYYGHAPDHSYFVSCSNGGRQGLMEAQRFPADFDGIVAGAPANDWTQLVSSGMVAAQALYGSADSYFPRHKLPALHQAVLDACDANDGLKDGLINDPTKCKFDPEVLRCKGEETRTCFMEAQIAAVKAIYRGADFFPGFAYGSELNEGGWGSWVVGESPGLSIGSAFVNNFFRYVVFDPKFNILAADSKEAERTATRKIGPILNATDTDLSRFTAHGGKLILFHGWDDAAISPYSTIRYYDQVRKRMGSDAAEKSIRLYMVPGMQHCAFGNGANSVPFGEAVQDWVENGNAPGTLTGKHFQDNNPSKPVQFTRPICVYPQVAQYSGNGDPNDAASFTCR